MDYSEIAVGPRPNRNISHSFFSMPLINLLALRKPGHKCNHTIWSLVVIWTDCMWGSKQDSPWQSSWDIYLTWPNHLTAEISLFGGSVAQHSGICKFRSCASIQFLTLALEITLSASLPKIHDHTVGEDGNEDQFKDGQLGWCMKARFRDHKATKISQNCVFSRVNFLSRFSLLVSSTPNHFVNIIFSCK